MDTILYKAGRAWAAEEGKTPRVSVLVPIYNAEHWLARCLDSLLAQTLSDIEIVCIDDGSTDASGTILVDYAARDGRISTLTKPNSGYGDSMNAGLQAARGSYIGIVEPDDFVDKRMFAHLLRNAEIFDCDVVKSNYYEVAGEGIREHETFSVIFGEFDYWQPFDPRDNTRILLVRPAIWTGLYRASWLHEQGITFNTTPGAAYQDISFNHLCLTRARRIKLVRTGHYRYRVDNAASSVNTGGKAFAVCNEYERTFQMLASREGDLEAFGPTLNAMRFAQYVWNYNNIEEEMRLPFAQRWADEMKAAREQGLLAEELLAQTYLDYLDTLIASPQAFCDQHPGQIAYQEFVW